jgi:predicted amidohydrolase
MVSMQPIKTRLAQIGPRLGDFEANLQLHLQVGERAAADGCDLLVFPELSLTGYYLRDLTADVALPIDAPQLQPLRDLSHRVDLVVGLVEESERHSFFTSAVYLSGGTPVRVQRKVYLPTYGMFDEGRYLSPGRTVRAFDTRFGRIGILICEDAWHPILPYLLAQEGIHTLIITANSPTRGAVEGGLTIAKTYEAMLTTYANLFQVYVVFCNRVGYEDGVNFWGGSCVVSPTGEMVARAPLLETAELDVELRPTEVRRARVVAPLVEEENLDIALRELRRIADERSSD